MCAEKEPLDCHRTVLVSRRLAEQGVAIDHLLADGSTRPHREVEEALLARNGGPDLFEDQGSAAGARLAGARTGDDGEAEVISAARRRHLCLLWHFSCCMLFE